MPLILHLSDLHMGSNDVIGDYKSDIVSLSERTTRLGLLEGTLRELGKQLKNKKKSLDAVVVTGDITTGNNEEGFKKLPLLLKELGDDCPPNERIVVIPGNHDVTWSTPASSPDRYKHFLALIRPQNYITPILDKVDSTPLEYSNHCLLDLDNEWVILPINSCNYSGSLEPIKYADLENIWENIPNLLNRQLSSIDVPKTKEALRKLRQHDVARVSLDQLISLKKLLEETQQQICDSGKDPNRFLKIVLIHHHLLPVSVLEEFKSFESISNLGHLRYFLKENGIDLVLHGHKHTGYVYWDNIYDYNPSGDALGSHRVLVVSGATIGGKGYQQSEICRLIEVEERKPAPIISITSIPVVHAGGTLPSQTPRHFQLWGQEKEYNIFNPELKIIDGDTLEDVYSRILTVINKVATHKKMLNIVCQVKSPSDPLLLPSRYPNVPGVDKQEWFKEIVTWWQSNQPSLAQRTQFTEFTHGTRIFSYGDDRGSSPSLDQLRRIIGVLLKDDESSRAIAVLVNPLTDDIEKENLQFPSFSLTQFVIRKNQDNWYLDCIGYFRKQEMRYWWPVNVAELHALQLGVLNRVKDKYHGLKVGTITTIAAIAVAGGENAIPKVAVPLIDQYFDKDKDKLWSMVYAVVFPDVTNKLKFFEQWERILNNLIPTESPDLDGVPIASDGLEYVCQVASQFAQFHPDSNVASLHKELRGLLRLNKVQLELMKEPSEEDRKKQWKQQLLANHQEWRDNVIAIVKDLRKIIDTLKQT